MSKSDSRRIRGIENRQEKGKRMRERERLTYRQFIQASYPSIKSSQPDLKFMIREAQGVNARAFVRFGKSRSSHCLVSRHLGLDPR